MYQGGDLRHLNRVVAFSGCALLLALFLFVAFSVIGLVVVFDDTGEVLEAVATNDHSPEQRLYRLPGGTFWAIPQFEGEIEIRCRNGSSVRGGYVGGPGHTRLEVREGCRLIEAP
jgi:hypothetical protein